MHLYTNILTAIDSMIKYKILKLNNYFDDKIMFYHLKKSDDQPNLICIL